MQHNSGGPQKPKEEAPKGPVAYKISYPAGLDPESANIPKDNALTEEKIKLGKKLYCRSMAAFLVPPVLRGIAGTAPHMHDGSQKTLEEVVSFYNKGGHKNK